MIPSSQQLSEALIHELEKECYHHEKGEHFYKLEKTNEVLKRFFKNHKLKKNI